MGWLPLDPPAPSGCRRYLLPERIAKAKDHETFWFGDYEKGFMVVPKRSIVYITMGGYRVASDGVDVMAGEMTRVAVNM